MGRAASMYSLFYHMDESGHQVGMQRFKSDEWDCIIVIDVELLAENVKRQTFDRIVVPKQGNRTDDYVIYDRLFIDMKVTVALTADQTNAARAFASK
eukprot:5998801-Lingulodinium_polyedra.AAC.1